MYERYMIKCAAQLNIRLAPVCCPDRYSPVSLAFLAPLVKGPPTLGLLWGLERLHFLLDFLFFLFSFASRWASPSRLGFLKIVDLDLR